MMSESRRKAVLGQIRPNILWAGEVSLGAWYTEEEIDAAVKAIRDSMDWNIGFHGKEIEEFEGKFAEYVGTKYAVAINSAQTGLDIAMMCLDLKPGDEVICPAINFPGDHLCIIGQGARVVLCEVDPGTLCADPADVERRITPRTRAILVTHMNGLSAPMDELLEVAKKRSNPSRPIMVIGDAARACGGGYKGTKIGKKGWMTVFSFHTQKLMCTLGEGGMISTDDPEVAERVRSLRSFGNGKSWGTNYKMTKVQAAVGLVQLRRLDEMIALRRKRAQERIKLLEGIQGLTLPYEPLGYIHTYYLYNILVSREWAREKRNRLMKVLADEFRVGTVVANPPTYTYNDFIKEHTEGQRLPLSEEIGSRLLCPSLHPLMTEEQNEYVAASIIEVVERVRKEG